MERLFETEDLGLAAAVLTILKIDPSVTNGPVGAVFTFPSSDALADLARSYVAGTLMVEARSFEQARRRLFHLIRRVRG